MTAPRVLFPFGSKNNFQGKYAGGASFVVNIGDLLYLDPTNGPTPFANMTDQGSTALNQKHAAHLFCGVAADQKISTDAATSADAASTLGLNRQVDAEYDCPSQTWELYDMVAAVENGGSNGLLSDQVTLTTDPEKMIGYVIRREPSAVTRVQVRLIANCPAQSERAFSVFGDTSNVQSITANKTLTVDDPRIQVLALDAAHNLILPNEALAKGLSFFVVNNSGGANSITVKASDGATTVGTIAQNKSGTLVCDGTTWYAQIGA